MPYTAGPFDTRHMYLQWGGKLPGGEQWSNGLRMVPVNTGPWPATDAASLIVAAKNAISAFHTRTTSYIDPSAKLSFVKLNFLDTGGHYELDTSNTQILADVAGTGTGRGYPNQCSMAITTETGFSRGPAHRGRIYLPLPTAQVVATGLVNSTDATNIKTSANTLLTALNALAPNYAVAVMSRKSGAPAHRIVTGFSVGLVMDTQRRRRRSLLESYV